MLSLSKQRWIWFSIVLMFIVSGNFVVYRLNHLGPLPKEIVIGSLIDFLIVVPALVYLFLLRKRVSIKYVLLAVLAGYVVASLIIPKALLANYDIVKYFIFGAEAVFLLAELGILYRLLVKLPAIIAYYHTGAAAAPAFQYRFQRALQANLKPSRLLDVLVSEIVLLYYSFFSWRSKQAGGSSGASFTYHKKTSAIVIYVMLIHSLILESVVMHFLLYAWNEIVAIVALIFSVYTLLYLLAEIQATRLCPFLLTDQELYLQIGMSKQLIVPLEAIQSIHRYEGPEKRSKADLKDVFDAMPLDIGGEKPVFEIEFNQLLEARGMYGVKKQVWKAHLRPDEPQPFLEAIQAKMNLL